MYALFDHYAARYDLHTPPSHYQHDHAFVLEIAAALGANSRMLDVGCGTGALLEKALRVGILAEGIDASPAMVAVAQRRVGENAVAVGRMQDLEAESAYDLVVALSWTVNYCANLDELRDVLHRMRRGLQPGGRLLLQVAHALHVDGAPMEDFERGPSGIEDDVAFRYRFVRLDPEGLAMRAEYEYSCRSLNEQLREEHVLHATDARAVARCAGEAGFEQIEIYDSWRRDPLKGSASPFVTAVKEPRTA